MACGARFYLLAIITTLIAIIVLLGLGKVSRHLDHLKGKHQRSKAADELD
jgi:uncharacterized membrane protein YhiD involved in acid resistance